CTCTHSKRYWYVYNKLAPNPAFRVAWPRDNELNTLCGATLINWLWYPANGDVRVELAHQVIAALNNVNGGACTGGGSGTALQDGMNLIRTCNITPAQYAQAQHDVDILSAYNDGTIGPGMCDENLPPPGPGW